MTRILGVDPGSMITGYGLIEFEGAHAEHLHSGRIQVRGENLGEKLLAIFEGLCAVIDTHEPDVMAIEQVFMHRNAASALKLGQARGAALLAGVVRTLEVHEYTPAQVKQAVTGRGGATKEQVQHMIKVLLRLPHAPRVDAADALAVGLCHGHLYTTLTRIRKAEERARSQIR